MTYREVIEALSAEGFRALEDHVTRTRFDLDAELRTSKHLDDIVWLERREGRIAFVTVPWAIPPMILFAV